MDHLLYTKDYFKGSIFEGHAGDYSYGCPTIACNSDKYTVKIGKFCSIAAEVYMCLEEDHNPEWISTYPFNQPEFEDFPNYPNNGQPKSKGDIIVGNDVWIGREAFILSGVHIGDGAVIGARAVVAKDVAPYSIVVGNPAREVKKRFSDEVIEKLLELKWWNWPIEKIRKFIPILQSPATDIITNKQLLDNIDKFYNINEKN